MKKAPLIIIIILVIVCAIFFFMWLSSSSGNSQDIQQVAKDTSAAYNPQLVKAKQDCQTSANTWSQQNPSTQGDDIIGVTAHFSSSLNTCLMEFTEDRTSGDNYQLSKVIDLTENKILLELDIDRPGGIGPIGEFLYENGQKVNIGPFGNALDEYTQRRNALFNG